MSGIAKAIEHFGGRPSALAMALGVSIQRLSNWGSRQVPAEICPAIERATGGAVRCEDLRPDVDWAYLRGSAPIVAELAAAHPERVPSEGEGAR